MSQKENIVILGGGFVGLTLARRLVKAGVVGKSCEVTVIDKSSSHTYTPWLYEVSSGYLSRNDGRKGRCQLYTSASVPFVGIPGYKDVRFRQEAITGVDFRSRSVFLADGLTVRYSILIIALGTESNYFGIPGLPEHCSPLKSASDAVDIERQVRDLLVDASSANQKNISIIGAGPTGVEFAGEFMMSIRKQIERGELATGAVKVSLIDRKCPLGAFPDSLTRAATKRLEKLGVNVLCNLAVMSVNQKVIELKNAAGDAMVHPCDLAIWSGGVAPVSVIKSLGLPLDPKGRILVDPMFAVKGKKNVYCAGDCASLMNPLSNSVEPMTAQSGVAQAKWIAKNLIAQLTGRSMTAYPFRARWDSLIAVGGTYGVGYVFGLSIKGPLAFYLRRLVDGRYFFSILPWPYALRKWLKGIVLYNKND
ncbi:MAG: NAD(P)/FAD-dependent oxidoreductase [Patescibacteria group bacterium]|jgi:NADH dehydrogenase